ncbi:MAG: DUF2029 domain-containing protein [Chloroflexota bacterium]|nr:DUF2029 domain-containing protein [Chloroflexota bacterium]
MSFLWLVVALRLLLSGRTVLNAPHTLTGDIEFYFNTARLSDSGFYPFIHFWVEYPPVFPALLSGLYRLLAALGMADLEWFAAVYAFLMSGVDLVNLVLVYRLVQRVRGERAARWAGMIYAGCPALVWVNAGWFDALAVLTMLGAVLALLDRRPIVAGVLIGLGAATKLFPVVLILAAPAVLGRPGTLRLAAAAGGVVAAMLAPLALIRSDLLVASFASMAVRGPWETIPALLSGYYGWGRMPLLAERFTAESAFVSTPTPVWLSLLPQAVLLVAVWAAWRVCRRGQPQPRDVCAVAALAVITFVLGNKGYSPQFVAWLVPVIVMAWPNRSGLAYVGLLSAHTLAYGQLVFPMMLSFYQGGEGVLEEVAIMVTVSVLLRTAVMAIMAANLCWDIIRSPNRSGRALAV